MDDIKSLNKIRDRGGFNSRLSHSLQENKLTTVQQATITTTSRTETSMIMSAGGAVGGAVCTLRWRRGLVGAACVASRRARARLISCGGAFYDGGGGDKRDAGD